MKRILWSLCLILALSIQSTAQARPKVYHYDGDIPMVTFMLNMMVAMGLIDRLPGGYDRTPWSGPSWYGDRSSPQHPYSGRYGYGRYGYPGSRGGRFGSPYFAPSRLDGVWLNSEGEMLGLRRDRMVWSDGESNYAMADVRLSSDRLYTRWQGTDQIVPIRYTLDRNTLTTESPDGVVRRYYRLPDTSPRF